MTLLDRSKNRIFARKLAEILAVVAILCLSAGCSSKPSSSKVASREIVVTTSHLEDLVSRVAGPEWEVSCIVPRGADPHIFEPSAESLKPLSQARLLFCVGAGLEGWIERIVQNAQRPDLKVVVLAEGLPLKKRILPGKGDSWLDPHIWMSPKLVSASVEKIAEALIELDPTSGSEYRKNAEAYQLKLDSLDAECREKFEKIPAEQRKVVTSHDALGYLAERYQLQVVATVIPHVSTEAAETSARDFQKLSELIRETEVKAIFADRNENPKLFEQLARESGVRVVPDLLLDSLGRKGSDAETFIGTYRHNVETILETLR